MRGLTISVVALWLAVVAAHDVTMPKEPINTSCSTDAAHQPTTSTSGTDMDNNHTTAVDHNRVTNTNCSSCSVAPLDTNHPIRSGPSSSSPTAAADETCPDESASSDTDPGNSCSILLGTGLGMLLLYKVYSSCCAAAEASAATLIQSAYRRRLACCVARDLMRRAIATRFRRRRAASVIQHWALQSANRRLWRQHTELRRRLVSARQTFADKMPSLTGHQFIDNTAMLLFPVMVAMPKVDARKCGALQKVLVGRLVRMGSSQRIAQKMMVSIVYYALEAEFKAYLLNGDTNTTYFTRLAQYLGNYLKGVEALGNDMSKMFVDDVDAGFLDRFPVFSGEIGSRVSHQGSPRPAHARPPQRGAQPGHGRLRHFLRSLVRLRSPTGLIALTPRPSVARLSTLGGWPVATQVCWVHNRGTLCESPAEERKS